MLRSYLPAGLGRFFSFHPCPQPCTLRLGALNLRITSESKSARSDCQHVQTAPLQYEDAAAALDRRRESFLPDETPCTVECQTQETAPQLCGEHVGCLSQPVSLPPMQAVVGKRCGCMPRTSQALAGSRVGCGTGVNHFVEQGATNSSMWEVSRMYQVWLCQTRRPQGESARFCTGRWMVFQAELRVLLFWREWKSRPKV